MQAKVQQPNMLILQVPTHTHSMCMYIWYVYPLVNKHSYWKCHVQLIYPLEKDEYSYCVNVYQRVCDLLLHNASSNPARAHALTAPKVWSESGSDRCSDAGKRASWVLTLCGIAKKKIKGCVCRAHLLLYTASLKSCLPTELGETLMLLFAQCSKHKVYGYVCLIHKGPVAFATRELWQQRVTTISGCTLLSWEVMVYILMWRHGWIGSVLGVTYLGISRPIHRHHQAFGNMCGCGLQILLWTINWHT